MVVGYNQHIDVQGLLGRVTLGLQSESGGRGLPDETSFPGQSVSRPAVAAAPDAPVPTRGRTDAWLLPGGSA